MTLKYGLYENHLTNKENDYSAIVQNAERVTLDDIIDRMVGRGSTVTKAEALSVLEEFHSAIRQLVSEGKSVNTPLFNIAPSIKGSFEGTTDVFDPFKHEIKVRIQPGKLLKDAEATIKVEKVATSKPTPVLAEYEDINTKTFNDEVKPGGIGIIRGQLLKVNQSDENQGIFFTDSKGKEHKVALISRNVPSELNFLIPANLKADTYSLSVKAIINNGKEVRKGTLSYGLVVK